MTKINRYFNLFINTPRSFSPKNHVFILSHMRSTSSLLSHILSSHEQICGHKELHSSYTNPQHLLKTRATLYTEKDSFEKAEYLLDKLLHNKLIINEKIFKTPPKYIFLLRNPERTMSSMIKMHLGHNNKEDTIYKLEDYYLNRINVLIDYWNNLNGDKIFLTSEQLIEDTNDSLLQLSEFLSLSKPLNAEYSVYRDTGKSGLGDTSTNIKTGKILKSTPIYAQGKELLKQLNMDKINEAYNKAVKTFGHDSKLLNH